MEHIIVEAGPFALAFDELVRTTTIAWGDALPQEDDNALAVPSAAGKLACIPCRRVMVAAV